MSHHFILLNATIITALILSLCQLGALIHQRHSILKAPIFILAGIVMTITLVIAGAGIFIVSRPSAPPLPGAVVIQTGGGSAGCVVDVAGTADLPAGRDAWLFLTNERSDYYAQGGRPIVQGPAKTDWVFPKARVANQFFANARYTWLAIVVSRSTSERLQREVSSPGNAGWQLPTDKFPLTEQISARASTGLLLSVDADCGH